MSVQTVGYSSSGIRASYSASFTKVVTVSARAGSTGKEGDTVSLSAQSIGFQQEMLASQSSSPDDWKKIIDSIKQEYQNMKARIIDTLFNGQGGQENGVDSVAIEDPRTFDEIKEIPGLPDYWSAEKTAQRIVDFATSFLSEFKGGKDEFVNMIKDAIEKGFSQAKDISGNLPNPINKLVAKTHALVMDKIDEWASQQNAASAALADQATASV